MPSTVSSLGRDRHREHVEPGDYAALSLPSPVGSNYPNV
jgi:hypothetical protein